MNKKAQDFELEGFELEDIGLTIEEWRSTLIKINDEAKRLYNKAKLSEQDKENPEAKEMTAKAQRKALMLHRRAKALMTQLARAVQNLDIKRNEYSTKKLSPRDIESGAGRRRTRENVGSGAGYSASRNRGRGGPDGIEYRDDIQEYYGTTPPIGMTINLDQSSLWAGVKPNPLGTISLNDFARTGGRVLAEDLFSGMPVSKPEVDQKIFNFLRSKGLLRTSQLHWSEENQASYVWSPQGYGANVRTRLLPYPLERIVNESQTGQTYDELYDRFSRSNSFELFRKFAISLKREISRVTRQMSKDGAPSVLIKNARRFGPKWVRVLNAKIEDLA